MGFRLLSNPGYRTEVCYFIIHKITFFWCPVLNRVTYHFPATLLTCMTEVLWWITASHRACAMITHHARAVTGARAARQVVNLAITGIYTHRNVIGPSNFPNWNNCSGFNHRPKQITLVFYTKIKPSLILKITIMEKKCIYKRWIGIAGLCFDYWSVWGVWISNKTSFRKNLQSRCHENCVYNGPIILKFDKRFSRQHCCWSIC